MAFFDRFKAPGSRDDQQPCAGCQRVVDYRSLSDGGFCPSCCSELLVQCRQCSEMVSASEVDENCVCSSCAGIF